MATEAESEYDIELSILMLGDSSVGKTSIVRSFMEEPFIFGNFTTSGVDFRSKTIVMDNHPDVKAQIIIWEAVGQTSFRSVVNSYYRRADCYILVFDITSVSSFHNIDNWLRQTLEENQGPDKIFILMGNKMDIDRPSNISMQEIHMYYSSNNFFNLMFMVSAKTGDGIEDAFHEIVDMMYDRGLTIGRNKKSGTVLIDAPVNKEGASNDGQPGETRKCLCSVL